MTTREQLLDRLELHGRMDKVLDQIRLAWLCYPNLRLGQLISNACIGRNDHPDIFFLEDDELVARLQKMVGALKDD